MENKVKIYRNITDLRTWNLNPRDIDEESFLRLKDQLTLKGQFAPLLMMPDGLVLGGNMRLKALLELGINDVWVTVVNFIQKGNGLWYAIHDGIELPEPFENIEDAKMSWSLAHNADYGHYDMDAFANIQPNYGIDWSKFAVNFDIPEDMQTLMDSIAPEEASNKSFKRTIIITVDSEEKQKELYTELTTQGYNAKIKTTLSKQK